MRMIRPGRGVVIVRRPYQRRSDLRRWLRWGNGCCSRASAILGRRRHSSAVEQLFRKQQVLGSNPSVGSTFQARTGAHRVTVTAHLDASRRPPGSQNSTGSDSSARSVGVLMRTIGPATAYSGIRRKSSSKTIFASSLASGAPRQWWIPSPNETWRCGSRVMSSRSGSTQRRSSRLADAHTQRDARALRDRPVVGLDIAGRRPREGLDRRVEAEELLDRRRDDRRVVADQVPLVREPVEVEQRIRDQPGCGRDARDEQQHRAAEQLVRAESARPPWPRPGTHIRSSRGARRRSRGRGLHVRAHLVAAGDRPGPAGPRRPASRSSMSPNQARSWG